MCLFLGLGLKTLGVLQGCLGSRRLDGLLGFGCRTVWPLRFRVQGLLKSASCFRHIAHRMSEPWIRGVSGSKKPTEVLGRGQ